MSPAWFHPRMDCSLRHTVISAGSWHAWVIRASSKQQASKRASRVVTSSLSQCLSSPTIQTVQTVQTVCQVGLACTCIYSLDRTYHVVYFK